MPAVLKIIDVKQFDHLKEIYINILINDPAEEVRLTAISCLHVICELVGFEESHNNLKAPIIKLFKEKEEILDKFLEVLPEVLLNLYKKNMPLESVYF